MKIGFVQISNKALPEPYPNLKTDVLYLTTSGYVYPEGSDKPIDFFDPNIISKISETPITTISDDAVVELPETDNLEAYIKEIKKHKDLLAYINLVKYATYVGIMNEFDWDRNYTKEIVTRLIKMDILSKYETKIKIGNTYKNVIDFELERTTD